MTAWIIDAHMHTNKEPSYLIRDMRLRTLLDRMDELDIEKGVGANIISMHGHFEEGFLDDKQAYELSGGRVYSMLAYDPRRIDESLRVIEKYHDDKAFRAIKIHPSEMNMDADDERYRPVWDIARKYSIPLMSHTWSISSYHPSQNNAFPGRFERYISEYPDVSFTFAHSGGRWDGIVEAVRIGKQHKNCSYDIAGDILGNGVLEYMTDVLGIDRIMYGSDIYMIEQRPMLGVIIGSALSGAAKEKILRYNAQRIYFRDVK